MPDPRISILNDIPVHSLAEDALDFKPYVQALAEVVTTGCTPLTLGVFGDWGSGKTSLMRMLAELCQKQGAVTGWFDAWKYDKEDTLWRAFLLATLGAVRQAAAEGEPLEALDYLETMLYRGIDLEKAGGVTIDLAKLGGKLAQGVVQIGLTFIPGGGVLEKLIEELQKSGAQNATEHALEAIRRERSKIHIEQVRFLEQFQDKFRVLVDEHILRRGKRLVVFVDDLDRCLPEKAIEVLEAMKLFVDAPGCVFVLGLDQEVIARGVELRYRELNQAAAGQKRAPIDGKQYLEKIIQLPFQIPPVEERDLDDFVGGLAGEWPHPDCRAVFAQGLGRNPRQIKRTVNVFHLLWKMAEQRNMQGVIKPVLLAKVVAIQTAAPLLYELLKEQPGLLRDLELYYQAEAEARVEERPGIVKAARRAAPDRPALPEGLTGLLSSYPAAPRILQVWHPEDPETSFATLTPLDAKVYFSLTRRAESPQSAAVETARLPFEPQMVRIPAGKFQMGTTPEQAQRTLAMFENDADLKKWMKDEQPHGELDLPEYLIGKYLVTNREYQFFVREAGYRPPEGWEGENYPEGKGDHPVVKVSWEAAQAYCLWLSQATGKNYGLPSEAEWEKAARGSDGRLFAWGDEPPGKELCNVENWFGGTTPVGQFSPAGDSPYGCCDMIGNVWEWTRSIFKEYPYNPTDGREDLERQDMRVLRGGSFLFNRRYARCASRDRCYPYLWDGRYGFRVGVVSPILSDI